MSWQTGSKIAGILWFFNEMFCTNLLSHHERPKQNILGQVNSNICPVISATDTLVAQ